LYNTKGGGYESNCDWQSFMADTLDALNKLKEIHADIDFKIYPIA